MLSTHSHSHQHTKLRDTLDSCARWLAVILLLLLFLHSHGWAQGFKPTGNAVMVHFNGAPSGSCFSFNVAVDDTSGDFYDCFLGSWLKVTGAGGTGGSGTVTSFSAGTLSPLFTTSVATSTATPALSFSLSNAAAHTFFGNNTSSSAAPGFQSIGTGDLPGSGALTVNTSSPLGGGGSVALGSSLTLTCTTCLTSNAVSSVFSRTGAVVATSGDYTAAQVTNAFDVTAANTLTTVAAPASPTAGKVAVYTDSTNLVLSSKNSSGTVSSTVVPQSCTNQVLSALSAAGALTCHTIVSGDTSGTFSATAHNLLSATHGDTVAHTVVLGDILFGNSTPAWAALAGNTTGTKKFLTQTGTGTVSAFPGWNTIAGTDLPVPGASSLGGVDSKDCTGTGHVLSINTDGSVTCSADTGGGGGVSSVSGTANQITSTGGTTPVLALANPLTFPGEVTYAAATTGAASNNMPSGTAPTTPAAGDEWRDGNGFNFVDSTTINGTLDVRSDQAGVVGAANTVRYTGDSNVAKTSVNGGALEFNGLAASALTAHAITLGNGNGELKALASLGTTTTVLHGNASADPSYASVARADLGADAVGWQFLCTATTATSTVTCTPSTARKHCMCRLIITSYAGSGGIARFELGNSTTPDTGTNYAFGGFNIASGTSSAPTVSGIGSAATAQDGVPVSGSVTTTGRFVQMNVSNSGTNIKYLTIDTSGVGASAAVTPNLAHIGGTWNNTTNGIGVIQAKACTALTGTCTTVNMTATLTCWGRDDS